MVVSYSSTDSDMSGCSHRAAAFKAYEPGKPADVITRKNIREIYGMDAKLVMSDGGYPICMEFDRVIKTL